MQRLVKVQPVDMTVTKGAASSFGENIVAAYNRAELVGEVSSRNQHLNEVYGPFTEFFNSTVRTRAPDFFSYGVDNSTRDPGPPPLSRETWRALESSGMKPDETLLGKIATELSAAGIEMPENLRPEALTKRRQEMDADLVRRVKVQDDVLDRGGIAGQLLGGFVAVLDDIEAVVTLPIGATARMGILATAFTEGLVNAGTEAVSTPTRNRFLEELGLPQESAWMNAAGGFAAGAVLGGGIRAGRYLFQEGGIDTVSGAMTKAGSVSLRAVGVMQERVARQVAKLTKSPDPSVRGAAVAVERDLEDVAAAVTNPAPETIREHDARLQAAREMADGADVPIPERPVEAVPRSSILGGEIEEIDPRNILVQPKVFQFKSELVGEAGETPKLMGVTEWSPERAGIVLVYEYADGSRAIADGHQRTALANRIMAANPGSEIKLAAKVFREADGFTPEDIRVLSALKNIAEAADGMTSRMALDAAKVLRVKPDAISQLPQGPGIRRARELGALSDEAFDMVINRVIPEDQAALIGRLVRDPAMQTAMAKLIQKVQPETAAQAESVIRQAMETPVVKEETFDLFGALETTESLYLERAKVLERTMKALREDRAVFKTITEQAQRIEGTGENRLDAATNKQIRETTEQALAAVQSLAHRSGPISAALNDAAKAYRENGRLKDAAESVARVVRGEIERNGLAGLATGGGGRAAEPHGASRPAPDPAAGFADPQGQAAREQIEATRIDAEPVEEPGLFDMVPIGRTFDDEGNELAVAMSRQDLANELDADDAAVGFFEACLRKGV